MGLSHGKYPQEFKAAAVTFSPRAGSALRSWIADWLNYMLPDFGGRSCVLPCRYKLALQAGKLAQRRQAPMQKNDRAQVKRDKQC